MNKHKAMAKPLGEQLFAHVYCVANCEIYLQFEATLYSNYNARVLNAVYNQLTDELGRLRGQLFWNLGNSLLGSLNETTK